MRPDAHDATLTDNRPTARAKSPDRGSILQNFRGANRRLLLWRLLLAIFLTGVSSMLHFLDTTRVAGPGLVATLGLLYTSLGVAWAASLAAVRERLLLGLQLAADVLCIGLLVHFSGGPYSAFPLFFCVPIMLAANYLGARWAVAAAGVAAIFTGGGHFGLSLGWLLTGQTNQPDYLHGWPVLVTGLHMSLFLVLGLIGGSLAQQLAQRRLAQARSAVQIQKARCEVRNILDNIQSGLLTVDRRGVVTRINPSCCRILELPEAEFLGKPLGEVGQGCLEGLARVILPVAAGGEAVHRGEAVVERQGRRMPLGLNVNPVISPTNQVIGAIAIFTDLTREKELSARVREADRLAAIGELAASIAHEIRNPLASIRGSVEILAGELDLGGYQRQLMDLVLKESSRVNTIINDFLAYSRMRPATLRRFAAAEFRDEITLQIRQHITAKDGQVQVICDVSPDDMVVEADPGQLTQMALNLAINACEALDYAGTLHISLNRVDGGQTAELVVSDDGPGIEPDIREALFSPFKTTKDGGTGLGLSVVARIASAHGGGVSAEDGPSGGALFRVRWPYRQLPDGAEITVPVSDAVAEAEAADRIPEEPLTLATRLIRVVRSGRSRRRCDGVRGRPEPASVNAYCNVLP